MSFTKGLYFIFDPDMTGFSKNCHHIIKIAAEVLSPDGIQVNYVKFHYLVWPPGDITPIITQLTGILNGIVEKCHFMWL